MSTSSNSNSDGGGSKAKKRNRKVASCNPCRARRIRCDRVKPCSACVGRKDETGCIWDSTSLAPLYERREANETERLKSEVERLQSLVDTLVSANPCPDDLTSNSFGLQPAPVIPPPPYPISNYQDSPQAITPAPGLSPALQPREPSEEAEEADLEAHDVVRRLSELRIKTFQLGDATIPNIHGDSLVAEAQRLLEVQAQRKGVDATTQRAATASVALSLFPTSSTPTSTQELVARVPPKHLVDRATASYFHSIAWYVHPITRQQYDEHEAIVFAAKEANAPAPAVSLAICFAVWALGLFGSTPEPPYAKYSKADLAVTLVELSRNALAIGRFLEEPSLDAIRAVILLATHYAVLAPGDDGGAGIGLMALAVQACLQLELHRDPDRRPNILTLAEAEDRRRLFWVVFVKDVEIGSSVLGRRFTLLHVRDCDTKLPRDLDDYQLSEPNPQPSGHETIMTALVVRMRFAKLTEQITDEVFGIHPVSYSLILEFDRQIRELEAEVPPFYRLDSLTPQSSGLLASKSLIIDLALRQEILRLHRPYLARSFVDDKYAYSRAMCVKTAREVLELQRSPLLQAVWACILYKGITAAVVLCIDLMYDQSNSNQAELHKYLVRKTIERLEQYTSVSTLSRRGSTLLRFLMGKIDAAGRSFRPNEDKAPVLKRTRTAPGTLRPPSDVTASFPPGGNPFGPEEEQRRRMPRSTSDLTGARNGGSCVGTAGGVFTNAAPATPLWMGNSSPAAGDFASPSVARCPSTSTMRSAAEEIASVDFPALLGLDGNSSLFSFDMACAPPPPPPTSATGDSSSPAFAYPTPAAQPTFAFEPQSFDSIRTPTWRSAPGEWSFHLNPDAFPTSTTSSATLATNAFSSVVPPVSFDFDFSLPATQSPSLSTRPAVAQNGGFLGEGKGSLMQSNGGNECGLKQAEFSGATSWDESGWAEWLRRV